MNSQRIGALIRKDLRELLRNRQALAPIIIVPVLFVVVLPTLVLTLGQNRALMASINGVEQFLSNLPAGILPQEFNTGQSTVYAVVIYFFAPLFLLLPVMVGSTIASASFVGEKERRTIEGLLYSPLTNRELVFGKILVSMIPAVSITWTALVLYGALVNILGFPLFGSVIFPTWTWVILAVLIVPLIAFLSIALIVSVSQRSTTVQGAQGSAMFLVLPLIGLVIAQAAGISIFNAGAAMITACGLLAADILFFVFVVSRFDRERFVTRL